MRTSTTTVIADRTMIIEDKVIFPGRADIPAPMAEKLNVSKIELPPGTVLRGIYWLDINNKQHVKWVAYVE